MDMRRMKKCIVVGMAGFLVISTQSPARAQETLVDFVYQPSELTHASGTQRLAKRLHLFARSTCRGPAMTPHAIRRKCQMEIIAQLVAKIGDAQLAALFGIDASDAREEIELTRR